jgi:hypothetical protein
VSEGLFDTFPGAGANPNANPICGKAITINCKSFGVSWIPTKSLLTDGLPQSTASLSRLL